MKRKQKSLKYLNRIRDMLSEKHCNNVSVSFDLELKLLDIVIDTINEEA